MIQTLYSEKEAVLSWLRQAPRSYKDWLREYRDSEVKTLKNNDSLIQLHRSQGRVDVIDRLIGLETELQTKGL